MSSCYLHTPLPCPANDALARVATLRLARRFQRSCTSLVADLGMLLCMEGPPVSAEEWRQILSARHFDEDLESALADSTALRLRFRKVALTALMVLRNPLGRRRKVGGMAWPEQRLFDQVRSANPDFVLLRQAVREVRADCCDAEAACAFSESLPRLGVRLRFLPAPSPFARHWSQAIAGPGESAETPDEILRRLHESLGGGPCLSMMNVC
jgi:Lhr-like helicase